MSIKTLELIFALIAFAMFIAGSYQVIMLNEPFNSADYLLIGITFAILTGGVSKLTENSNGKDSKG